MDVQWMCSGTQGSVEMSETEKITINLGLVDLGQVDLLVQEGFYSNRTDFIRTAIRNQLSTHAEVVRQTVARKTLVLGLEHYTRRDLEAVKEARSEEHTSELQSRQYLVCRLLLEKKKKTEIDSY